jgi:hypothetical protein
MWYKLGTCSRRALLKTKGRYGRPYRYTPRGDLLERLSEETGASLESVVRQLNLEREYLLKLNNLI